MALGPGHGKVLFSLQDLVDLELERINEPFLNGSNSHPNVRGKSDKHPRIVDSPEIGWDRNRNS